MAYSFQTFSVGEILTASKMNQVEVNIRDHAHGTAGVSLVATGGLVDSSVTTAKLAGLSVTDVILAASAVTEVKLADLAVTEGKLAASAVASGKLKLATGSKAQGASVSEVGAVNQFAFGAPIYSGPETLNTAVVGVVALGSGATSTRSWFFVSGATTGTYTWTWDYVTASGNPKMWAVCDVLGTIQSLWEAEDPFDPDDEDANPFGPVTPPPGGHVVQIQWPTKATLLALVAKAGVSLTPQLSDRWKMQCRKRHLVELSSLDDVYAVPDTHRLQWYAQLFLREVAMAKALPRSMGPLLIQYCRVASDGTLTVTP